MRASWAGVSGVALEDGFGAALQCGEQRREEGGETAAWHVVLVIRIAQPLQHAHTDAAVEGCGPEWQPLADVVRDEAAFHIAQQGDGEHGG